MKFTKTEIAAFSGMKLMFKQAMQTARAFQATIRKTQKSYYRTLTRSLALAKKEEKKQFIQSCEGITRLFTEIAEKPTKKRTVTKKPIKRSLSAPAIIEESKDNIEILSQECLTQVSYAQLPPAFKEEAEEEKEITIEMYQEIADCLSVDEQPVLELKEKNYAAPSEQQIYEGIKISDDGYDAWVIFDGELNLTSDLDCENRLTVQAQCKGNSRQIELLRNGAVLVSYTPLTHMLKKCVGLVPNKWEPEQMDSILEDVDLAYRSWNSRHLYKMSGLEAFGKVLDCAADQLDKQVVPVITLAMRVMFNRFFAAEALIQPDSEEIAAYEVDI